MTLKDVLMISPSGKLYGSERVLLDYIAHTSLNFDIAVPAGSDLQAILSNTQKNIKQIEYAPGHLTKFYLRLSIWLLLRRYNKVYINEAGHIKYILLLARLFPFISFTVHVRIAEDTHADRWKTAMNKMPGNLKVITISEYIARLMQVPNIIIADPFIFNKQSIRNRPAGQRHLRVGIIGRISGSKGINILPYLLAETERQELKETISFHLYGDMGTDIDLVTKDALSSNKNIVLHGYVKESGTMYDNLDVVLHLSETEPLGRIFFEAVNNEIPFVGINAGGIGETATKYSYTELMVEPAKKELMASELIKKILLIKNDMHRYINVVIALKQKMSGQMSVIHYCTQLDLLINQSGN